MIKAAIFMGDPRYIPGLSYNVGTCQASGVSITASLYLTATNNIYSSPLAHRASSVHPQARSKATVMPRTHTAATVTTQTRIKVTEPCTGSKRWPSSTANSVAAPQLQQLPPVPPVLLRVAVPLRSTDSVVDRAGLARLLARVEALARLLTSGTRSACKSTGI